MARGFKIAHGYVEISVDKDDLRRGIRDVPRAVGPDADRAGREIGDKVGRGLAASVESWSGKIAKARRQEQIAAQGVTLAETRLNEARAKGIGDGSRLLALEQQLERAKWKLTDANKAAATATSKHTDAQRRLAESLTAVGKDLGPAAQRAGDDAGGKLAIGMRMSIIRNSPLIVAAIGAGLVAGAPVVLAGATGLFAGIGIAAAAQSEKVQSAWKSTWEGIRAGAIQDAAAIEPVLIGLADRVGDGFERMRPRLRGIFDDTAPQIEVFADGLMGLAENSLPGFERAIARGMPVTRGFADFLEKTGTGLTGFLDGISSRAPQAAQAFSGLGDTMGTLLPLTGELLGQGAELATVVLPLLNGSLGGTLAVIQGLGPVFPAVVTGLLGMKAAQMASGHLDTLAQKLAFASYNGGTFASTAGKASTAVSTLARATPALVSILVGFVAVQEQAEATGRKWASAMLEGGAAADIARTQMSSYATANAEASQGLGGFAAGLLGVAGQAQLTTEAIQQGTRQYDEMLAAMDPVRRSAALLTQAENDLAFALEEHGAGSKEVVAAQAAYDAALANSERANEGLERAIDGVTQAMVDQGNQAMASIDSGFAYQHSLNQLEDAQTTYNDAVRDHGAASEEASRAQLALQEQAYGVAQAWGVQAADLSGLEQGTAQYTRYVQEQTLARLMELRRSAGPEMAAALDQQISRLQASGVQINATGVQVSGLTQRMRDLGWSVHEVPGQKFVRVDAPTAAQVQQMRDLGWHVTHLPNGSVYVSANVADANAALNWAARPRTTTITAYTQTVGHVGGRKDGGPIFAATGRKVIGAGGPRDDLVRAFVPNGPEYRLSAGEWIVNAFTSRLQGDAKMAALNAGQADIVPRRRLTAPSAMLPSAPSLGAPPTVSGGSPETGTTLTVQRMDVHLHGFDIRQQSEARRFVDWIEAELVKKTRARAGTIA